MSGGGKGDGERLTDVKVIKNDLANAVNRHGRMVGIVVTYRGLKSRLSEEDNVLGSSCNTWNDGSFPAK